MTKMSKEEKKAAALARLEDKKREWAKFPSAHYAPGKIQLICKGGDEFGLYVRTDDLTCFKPILSTDALNEWVSVFVPLTDIVGVAELVAALTLRLNYQIEEANANIRKCKIAQLESAQVEGDAAR